jgi:two-component system, LuxR family, sensor kinase FixL
MSEPTDDRSHLDQARLAAIMRSAQDAIICIDRVGIVTVFNPAAERIFGYEAAEVVGRNVDRLMPSPYAEAHDQYLRHYRETGEARALGRVREVAAKRRDGTVFPIELSVSEVVSDGDVTYAAVVRDVSDRRGMEEQLRAERDFADSLIDTAHVIVLVLDAEGRIVRYNRHLEEITGHRFDQVARRDWFETFIPERERPRLREIFEAALRGSFVQGHVNPIVTRKGDERQIQWYVTRLLDADGEVIGVVSVGHDITERLLARSRLTELEHASRQNDRLADIGAITTKLVHDLGNPLAALTMQAQLVLRRARRGDFQPADVVEKPIEQMLETLKRLEALVREFTDFSREQRLKLSPVTLPTYLHNVVALWEAYGSARGVSLRTKLGSDLPQPPLDPELFRRVLDNVIKNAIDAIDPSGEVVVKAHRHENGSVRISVADDGCGIPPDIDVFRLFETTKPEGTGIGLAIAKQIVIAHGGEIHYEPRSPRGTVFHIDLPTDEP